MDSTALLIAGMGTLATVIGVLFKWGRDSMVARLAEGQAACAHRIGELKEAHAAELARRDSDRVSRDAMVQRLLMAVGRTREAAALKTEDPT